MAHRKLVYKVMGPNRAATGYHSQEHIETNYSGDDSSSETHESTSAGQTDKRFHMAEMELIQAVSNGEVYPLKTFNSLSEFPGVKPTYNNLLYLYNMTKSYVPISLQSSINQMEILFKIVHEDYVMPQLSYMTDDKRDSWFGRVDRYTASKLDSICHSVFPFLRKQSVNGKNYLNEEVLTPLNSITDKTREKTEEIVERVFSDDDIQSSLVNRVEQMAESADPRRFIRIAKTHSSLGRHLPGRLQELSRIPRDELGHMKMLYDFFWFAQDQLTLKRHLLQETLHQNMEPYWQMLVGFNELLMNRPHELVQQTWPIFQRQAHEVYAIVQFFYSLLWSFLLNASTKARLAWQQSLNRFLWRLEGLHRELDKELDFYESARAKKILRLAEEGVSGLKYITNMALKYSGIPEESSQTFVTPKKTGAS